MFLTFLFTCLLFSLVNTLSHHPILIVVSYDAFRYNYFDKKANPYMLKLREKGTHADYMRNVFPTKTFPNHHSISTGLYPEKHGVIGNNYYNATSKDIVEYSYQLFHYDESIIPIWRLNERLGQGRHSGIMMWPGGSFPYQGELPTYSQAYEPNLNLHNRIDIILSWIENSEKPANLVMLYFEEPDKHGHIFGTDSKQVYHYLQQLDNVTYYLQQQLEFKGMTDKVNVIHLSDHGMCDVSPPKFIDITQYLPQDTYKLAESSPTLHVIPYEEYKNEVYELLKNASLANGHFTVYRKRDMPSRWRFKNNARIPPLFLLADEGYGFQDLSAHAEEYVKKYHITVSNESKFGIHGYNTEMPQMRPFFFATGPQIKVNHKVPPFDTVDLFNLFCELLKITPTKNDGYYPNVQDVMEGYHGSMLPIVIIIAGGILLVLFLILSVAVVTILIIKRQQSITTTAALNKRFPQNFSHSNIEVQHLLEPEDA